MVFSSWKFNDSAKRSVFVSVADRNPVAGAYHVQCDGNTVISMYDWEPRKQKGEAQQQESPSVQDSLDGLALTESENNQSSAAAARPS